MVVAVAAVAVEIAGSSLLALKTPCESRVFFYVRKIHRFAIDQKLITAATKY